MSRYLKWILFACSCLSLSALLVECRSVPEAALPTLPVQFEPDAAPYKMLSEYRFFYGQSTDFQSNTNVLPYDLITPLFSDYAHKARFLWMPDSVQASVDEQGNILFPDNTVLIKHFYYPTDFRKPEKARRLMETRLLMRLHGEWQAFTYVWDDAQQDARLNIVGDFKPVKWIDERGKSHAITYAIPNKNQCKSCHNSANKLLPVGPKVRNLNRAFAYADGTQNQLEKWQELGLLQPFDNQIFTPVAQWDDPQSGSISERALAYLDVNCGHCHNPKGPAHTTGLYLTADQTNPRQLGLCKPPVAAGKGSGGHRFGVLPGKPDSSILYYRMRSDDPGVMMPEIGRMVPHEEGLALIRAWIQSLEGSCN